MTSFWQNIKNYMIEWMNEWIKILSVLQESEEKGDEEQEQDPPPIMITEDYKPGNIVFPSLHPTSRKQLSRL